MTKQEFYAQCMNSLRTRKLEHTKIKQHQRGAMDGDDSNALPIPDGWQWNPPHGDEEGRFFGMKHFSENYQSLLEQQPAYVNPDSSMAGGMYMTMYRMWWNPKYAYTHLAPLIEQYALKHGISSTQHMCGDVRIGLELGWSGLLEKVRHFAAWNASLGEKQRLFYECEERMILAIQEWIRKTIREIGRQIELSDDLMVIANLTAMRNANENIIERPPRTMREACQFMSWYNMAGRQYNGEGAGGQLDELLRPYYEKDIAEGTIDDDDAVFYIAGLLMADTKYYQLGGPDMDGKDMVSKVSFLILDAAESLNTSLNLTVRVHDGLDESFFLRSVKILFQYKNGWPRFSGDKALVEGCIRNGFTPELARQRIAVGCNWMALPGLEYPHNDTMKINCARCFELAMDEMMTSPEEPSLDHLWMLYHKHLRKAIDIIAQCIDWHMEYQWDNCPDLFLNLFMVGAVEKGIDVSNGSAMYYNFGIDGMGLSIIADSMAALETRVVHEDRIRWDELYVHLKNDYQGKNGEWVRQMMLSCPRYGQGGSLADRWAEKVNNLWIESLCERRTAKGIKMTPGWFTWAHAMLYGKAVGATPNGRKAGDTLSINANPAPGFRMDGAVTAVSNAVAASQCGYGNTVPLQIEFDPGITEAEGGVEKVAAMIRAHFDLGGTLININVVDAKKIREAYKDPTLYPDLVVRVTGFTAYFASLSPAFRKLVVDRMIETA